MEQSKLTVWIICKYGSPERYGVASKPYKTALYLSENGVNTYLISSDSNHLASYPKSKRRFNWEHESRLNHIWIKTIKYYNSASIKRILSWISFEWYLLHLKNKGIEKPDIIVVSSLSLLTVLTCLHFKNKFKCKMIFEIRDIYPLTLTEELGVSPNNPITIALRYIEKLGYQKADLIVGTMPNLSSHVRHVLRYDKKVFFSPLGINDYWNKPIKASRKIDSLFPKNDSIIIGYAGSMGITNALDSFIKAIEFLKDRSNFYFVLVGKGDLKDDYVHRLECCPNAIIGPQIEQNEIPYFLSKCDILYLSTHPSRIWDYGQSMNKLVDYMMAGKPVIASYSGFPSMLNEARSGIFIKPNSTRLIIEAIEQYAEMNETDRKEIGQRGKKWLIKNYSNSIICEKYLNEMKALM